MKKLCNYYKFITYYYNRPNYTVGQAVVLFAQQLLRKHGYYGKASIPVAGTFVLVWFSIVSRA